MTDDLVKKLPQVGELSLPVWQDWLAQYDLLLREQDLRIKELEKHVKERDVFLVENDLWLRFVMFLGKKADE